MPYNTIHINPISPEPPRASVLVIYTGGTLGMVYETKGKQLVPFNFEQVIKKSRKSADWILRLLS